MPLLPWLARLELRCFDKARQPRRKPLHVSSRLIPLHPVRHSLPHSNTKSRKRSRPALPLDVPTPRSSRARQGTTSGASEESTSMETRRELPCPALRSTITRDWPADAFISLRNTDSGGLQCVLQRCVPVHAREGRMAAVRVAKLSRTEVGPCVRHIARRRREDLHLRSVPTASILL